MAIDVAPEVLVAAPRDRVAAFMFDPANDLRWTGGIVASRPLDEGPLRRGSRVERTSRFLGRRFSYVVEVVEADEASFVAMRVEKPFPMEIRYELEDEGGGTRVRIRARGEAGGFFRLAAPLLAPKVERSIAADLARLKAEIEATSPAGSRR